VAETPIAFVFFSMQGWLWHI